jgi:hypothetical protein
MNETIAKNNESTHYLTGTPESSAVTTSSPSRRCPRIRHQNLRARLDLNNNNHNNDFENEDEDEENDNHLAMLTRSNSSSSSASSMLSEDYSDGNENNNVRNNNQSSISNFCAASPNRIVRFFADILDDHSALATTRSDNFFYCTQCLVKFDSSVEFVAHCKNSVINIPGYDDDNNDDEEETASIVQQQQHPHYVFSSANCEEFVHELDASASRAMIVILMDKRMKQRFMSRYGNDLLVANEETALCLDELNREPTAVSGYSEEDTVDSLQSPQQDLSLLFIDYSIIQFNRVIKILQRLYSTATTRKATVSYDNRATGEAEGEEKCSGDFYTAATTASRMLDFSLITNEPLTKAPLFNKKLPVMSNKTSSLTVNNSSEQQSNKNSFDIFNEESSVKLTPASLNGRREEAAATDSPTQVVGGKTAAAALIGVQHSRNACKKLKCPKCNWHYKYRETLDIHMREKHANELAGDQLAEQCVYCVDSLVHPRLGRGEQYKCGYKPYRCEICDYSTTTKGNLSIHMQSDKHVNNVKEVKERGGSAVQSSPAAGHAENGGTAEADYGRLLNESEMYQSGEDFLENSSGSSKNGSLINTVNMKKIKDIYTSTFSLTSINSLNNGKLFYLIYFNREDFERGSKEDFTFFTPSIRLDFHFP